MGNHDTWAKICRHPACDNERNKGSWLCDKHEPTPERVAKMKAEIIAEEEAREKRVRESFESDAYKETARRSNLPSEDPDHIHGMRCDGQDGNSSYCERLRVKLFGRVWFDR